LLRRHRRAGLSACAIRAAEELFQAEENVVAGRVPPYLQDVRELLHLPDQLFQPSVFLHAEPNPAQGGIAKGHAENPIHVERAAGKQTAHMGHGAGMILDGQFQHGVRT
jgi:hypothetical protein